MTELLAPYFASPVYLFVLGALILPLLPKGELRALVTLIVPILSGYLIWNAAPGLHGITTLGGLEITMMRVDKLSTIFGLIFSLAAFLSGIYAWHVRDSVQQIATLLYAGTAIGAVFAGDLLSLFVYWEGTALASVFLIWARRTTGAYATGMRYLLIQIGSGVILIAGIALHYRASGSIAFDRLTGTGPESWDLGVWLIFMAFGVKCAFPLMHNWLQDSYPAPDGDRHSHPVRLHHQNGRILFGAGVSGHRNADLYRRGHDPVSDILRRDRKRPASRAGLFAEQPAWIHGGWCGCRHGTCAQRHRRPCVLPHPLQVPAFHVRWCGSVQNRYVEGI